MLNPAQLRPKAIELEGIRVDRMEMACPELNKFLHTVVGYDYRWGGRTDWDRDAWTDYATREGMETWVAFLGATPAGYFELRKEAEGDVQIVTFGLLPAFIGKGLGGGLLTRAVERAWELGATRVWLSTCSHDHPHALHNYKARGFRVARTSESPENAPIPAFWDLMCPKADGR